jgi:hypothetical protein
MSSVDVCIRPRFGHPDLTVPIGGGQTMSLISLMVGTRVDGMFSRGRGSRSGVCLFGRRYGICRRRVPSTQAHSEVTMAGSSGRVWGLEIGHQAILMDVLCRVS